MSDPEPLLLYAPPREQVPVTRVKGVSAKQAEALADSRFGIRTVQDLVQHYPRRHLDFSETKAIREVGAKSCILACDLGQAANPLHPDGLAAFFAGLAKEGISRTDIELMSQTNPARALGL